MSSKALLAVADAAGRVHLPEAEWLGGICAALRQARPRSVGAAGYAFRFAPGGVALGEHVSDSDVLGPGRGRALLAAMTTEQLQSLLATPALATTAAAAFGGKLPPELASSWRADGVTDALALVATLDDGQGVAIATAERQKLDGRVARQASLVVESLRTSLKLRRALGDSPIEQAVEAVFDPRGNCEHVAARLKTRLVALRRAVAERETAREQMLGGEQTNSAALGAWSALCEGRYRLVDHFDRDGRRYVVIVEATRPDPLRALTELETEIAELCGAAWGNKQIAFELGISESAAENHVGRILCKLRLDSRLELVRLYTQLEATANAGPAGTPGEPGHAEPASQRAWQ